MSVFQGDPAFKIDRDGSDFKFIEGQPVSDQGFENAVLISLFTKRTWPGNALFESPSQQIGSDFEEASKSPINQSGLNNRRDAALKSLQWAIDSGLFKEVFVNVTNPNSNTIIVQVRIIPPNGAEVDLTLENFGPNWRFQKDDPAHRRL